MDLPKTQAAPISGDNEPLTITLNGNGDLFVQETPSEIDSMVPQLLAIAENGYEQRIFVRADGSLPYSQVMQVMGVISSSGFTRVALVTESETKPARGTGER